MIPIGIAALGTVDASHPRNQIDDCLQALETVYMNLVSKSKWLAKPGTYNQESGFNVNGTKSNNKSANGSKLTCFNCGKEGHGFQNCDQPLDQARINANCEKFVASKSSNSSNPRSNNCSDCNNDSNSNLSSSNDNSRSSTQDLSVIPPKPGKPHVCVLASGKVLYWYQLCGKWNEFHETRYHSDKNAMNSSSHDPSDDQSHSGAPPFLFSHCKLDSFLHHK